tara:strand:+ start:1786 stop:2415 length:630 start_codon:yes stop_codon:yes gene_type:complete
MTLKINSSTIQKIYQSRQIILAIIGSRGYNIDDYEGFNITEIEVQYKNGQLDMLLEKEDGKKVLIKYSLETKIKSKTVCDIYEDVFNYEELLNKEDDLVIVTKENTNDGINNTIKELYDKEGVYINVFNIHNYLFNILEHNKVPKHRIMTNEEKSDIMKKYNVGEDREFPEIGRFDPVAKAIGIRPGQLCEIIRSSETSITSKYYRICI